VNLLDSIIGAYREGEYEAALRHVEGLREVEFLRAPYYFFRGSLLHQLGKLEEAEASLRQGLPLEKDAKQRALVCNTIGSVLLDQQRFREALSFKELAVQICPERGSNLRGVAEVWLFQGLETAKALSYAKQAVDIDRNERSASRDVSDMRLGEDLVVLAWAMALDSGYALTPEPLLSEALPMCIATNSKPILAHFHYYAGKTYRALESGEKALENFVRATQIDRQGRYGRLARSEISL